MNPKDGDFYFYDVLIDSFIRLTETVNQNTALIVGIEGRIYDFVVIAFSIAVRLRGAESSDYLISKRRFKILFGIDIEAGSFKVTHLRDERSPIRLTFIDISPKRQKVSDMYFEGSSSKVVDRTVSASKG